MTKDDLLSKTISYLRFPLTFGVAFIHFNIATDGFIIHGIKYGVNNPDWYYYIIILFSDVLPRIAVPLFFLFSGLLFFNKNEFNRAIYKQKLLKRGASLLVPYFLWNILAMFNIALCKLPFLSSLFPNGSQMSIVISPERLFNVFFSNYKNEGIFVMSNFDNGMVGISQTPYPIDAPLWFVRDLIVMVLLAPVIYWFIKKGSLWFVTFLGVVWFFIKPLFFSSGDYYGGYPVQLATAAFFFSCGAYFSIKRISFENFRRKVKYIPSLYFILVVVDVFTKKSDCNIYIHEVGIFVGAISAVVITSYLIEKGKIRSNLLLANSSFFIYSLHFLVIGYMARLVFVVLHLRDNTLSMLILYFSVPAITILLCFVTYIVFKRFLPKVCVSLSGGR